MAYKVSKDAIITRCGYRCDLCLAYKPNVIKNSANQQKLSDGWFKFFGFRIPPENIVCDGCMSDNPKLIDISCPVRPCVLNKGHKNCAECSEMICGKLSERIVVYDELRTSLEIDIPEDNYQCFIRPYENKGRLKKLAAGNKE
jgi:hypothetical protein